MPAEIKDRVAEHMAIVGSCGNPVGTVDRVDGEYIKLTRDSSPEGRHTYLPLSAVREVADGRVVTRMNHHAAIAQLRDAPAPGAHAG
jgi:hypothetical protein